MEGEVAAPAHKNKRPLSSAAATVYGSQFYEVSWKALDH